MILTSDPICSTAGIWCRDMLLSVLSVLLCATPALHHHSLTMSTRTHSLAQKHIYTKHDTSIQRLSWFEMSVAISVTWYCGHKHIYIYIYESEFFFLAFWSLVCLSSLFPITPPPSSCQAEEVCLSRHLICLVLSLALQPQCNPPAHAPRIDLMSAAAWQWCTNWPPLFWF